MVIILVLLHLAAIVFYRFVKGKALVPPMIHGRARLEIEPGHEPRLGSPVLACARNRQCDTGLVDLQDLIHRAQAAHRHMDSA
ncbi:MAG: hypothetical protein R3E83_17615 [Burkholderiaceae bacterium]